MKIFIIFDNSRTLHYINRSPCTVLFIFVSVVKTGFKAFINYFSVTRIKYLDKSKKVFILIHCSRVLCIMAGKPWHQVFDGAVLVTSYLHISKYITVHVCVPLSLSLFTVQDNRSVPPKVGRYPLQFTPERYPSQACPQADCSRDFRFHQVGN